MIELTDQEFLGLKTLEKRLKAVFFNWGVPGEFEDFFHDFHERYLLGYGHNQKLDFFAIDYIRRKYGRITKEGEPGARYYLENAGELYESMNSSESKVVFNENDAREEVDRISGRTRVIVGLILLHGLNSREVAFLLEVSESRVHQLIARFIHRKPGSSFKEDSIPNFEKLNKVEKAAAILGVRTLWLRDQLDKYCE